MASACALAMNSGRITYISRLSRSAERSKRYFHGKGRRGKQVALPATPLFPKGTGVADAVSIYDPSGENGFQESPQTFLKPEIKITFPLNMARAQRRPFKIVPRASLPDMSHPLFCVRKVWYTENSILCPEGG